jgi:hypothetical protein
VLNSELGVQTERAVEGRKDEATTVALRFLARASEYRALVESGRLRHTGARIDTMPVEVLSRDALLDGLRTRCSTTRPNVGSGLLTPDYTGKLVEQLVRKVRLLDRITIGRTDTDTVDWIVENARTDTAAETAFGTALPESSYGFSHKQTTVKRAGHHVVATRGILSRRRPDPHADRQPADERPRPAHRVAAHRPATAWARTSRAWTTRYIVLSQARGTDTQLDAVHKAMTKIRIATESQVEPGDLLIHPNDYEAIVLAKDANGNYLFGKPDTNFAPSIWGLPRSSPPWRRRARRRWPTSPRRARCGSARAPASRPRTATRTSSSAASSP